MFWNSRSFFSFKNIYRRIEFTVDCKEEIVDCKDLTVDSKFETLDSRGLKDDDLLNPWPTWEESEDTLDSSEEIL